MSETSVEDMQAAVAEGNEPRDLLEAVIEGFDLKIDGLLRECVEIVDGDDPKVFVADHPGAPSNIRVFGVQGATKHAWFQVTMGFVPQSPQYQISFSELFVTDGVVGEGAEDKSELIVP